VSTDAIRAVYDKQIERTDARLAEAQKAAEESRELLAAARRLHDRNTNQLQALRVEREALADDIRREFGS